MADTLALEQMLTLDALKWAWMRVRENRGAAGPDSVSSQRFAMALALNLLDLANEHCRAALVMAGLDPGCGFLHAPRPGRPALALDLMEEFRPVIADTVAWTLFNKRMLEPEHFVASPDGRSVHLAPEGWKKVAIQYTRRLDTGILIPDRKTRTTYRKLLEIQAWRLRRVIEGEQERYVPFLTR